MVMHKKVAAVVDKIKSRIEAAKTEDESNAPWIKQVAMLTGVLAALSGFLVVKSAEITNDAIYESNQAILAQTEASDAWNEYQADSIKARIVETALDTAVNLDPAKRTSLSDQDKDLRDRQAATKQNAAQKTGEREEHLKNGSGRLAEKDLLSYAGLAAQLGIALASVAALVRWRKAYYVAVLVGFLCIVLTAYAMAEQYGLLS